MASSLLVTLALVMMTLALVMINLALVMMMWLCQRRLPTCKA